MEMNLLHWFDDYDATTKGEIVALLVLGYLQCKPTHQVWQPLTTYQILSHLGLLRWKDRPMPSLLLQCVTRLLDKMFRSFVDICVKHLDNLMDLPFENEASRFAALLVRRQMLVWCQCEQQRQKAFFKDSPQTTLMALGNTFLVPSKLSTLLEDRMQQSGVFTLNDVLPLDEPTWSQLLPMLTDDSIFRRLQKQNDVDPARVADLRDLVCAFCAEWPQIDFGHERDNVPQVPSANPP